ncbi:hypothetical protein FRC07_010959 [Ceratobasidium sp. 392]|nr:hypothetical protein FRC07_010959 [Ceratobasidium sp. 392]
MLGTPDGYNTETSERLHIDFTKMGYRASNKVNATKQMALYIQRVEVIAMHEEHLQDTDRQYSRAQLLRELTVDDAEGLEDEEDDWDEWQDDDDMEDPDELNDAGVRVQMAIRLDEFLNDGRTTRVGGRWEQIVEPAGDADQGTRRFHPVPEVVTAKTPTNARITLADLQRSHDALRLHQTLKNYIRQIQPSITPRQAETLVPLHTKVNSWSRTRLFHSPPPFKPSEGPHIDVIRAQPVKVDQYQRVSRPARFDTVLIRTRDTRGGSGIHRYRPARVRAIFELPERLHHICDQKLVYVELFNTAGQAPNAPTGLFTTTRTLAGGLRTVAIYPLSDVAMTCHLAPRYRLFHPADPLTHYSDVLQLCEYFFINIFASYFLYELFRHWDQQGHAG